MKVPITSKKELLELYNKMLLIRRFEEKALANELKIFNKEVKIIRNRIKRLSDTSLDLELLDQQARIILGMIGEEELIVF